MLSGLAHTTEGWRREKYIWSFSTLAPSLFEWRPSIWNSCLWPLKRLKLSIKLTTLYRRFFVAMYSAQATWNVLVPLASGVVAPMKRLNFKSLKCFKEFGEILLEGVLTALSEYHSSPTWMIIRFAVLCFNVPKFLVHIRDGCLRKAGFHCSPATDVSDNRVAHYQSPELGCTLSWMPLNKCFE